MIDPLQVQIVPRLEPVDGKSHRLVLPLTIPVIPVRILGLVGRVRRTGTQVIIPASSAVLVTQWITRGEERTLGRNRQ